MPAAADRAAPVRPARALAGGPLGVGEANAKPRTKRAHSTIGLTTESCIVLWLLVVLERSESLRAAVNGAGSGVGAGQTCRVRATVCVYSITLPSTVRVMLHDSLYILPQVTVRPVVKKIVDTHARRTWRLRSWSRCRRQLWYVYVCTDSVELRTALYRIGTY